MTDDPAKLPPLFRKKYEKAMKQLPRQELTEKKMPEGAVTAVKELKRLEARCQAGISYRDYSPALGEAKYAVNMFVESNDVKDFEDLKASLKKVMWHYEYAQHFWKMKNAFIKYNLMSLDGPNKEEITMLSEFFKNYPETNKSKKEGGIISDKSNMVNASESLRYIFSVASKELANSFAIVYPK